MPRKKKEEPVVSKETKNEKELLEKSDAVVAAEIEVKKNVRAAGRKVKEKVEDAVKQAATSDAVVATEIEVKKAARKAGRKAKATAEAVENVVKKATVNIIIESPMGGSISTDEIAAKIPNGATAVYVRVDVNKLYWVKGDETGSVAIWD